MSFLRKNRLGGKWSFSGFSSASSLFGSSRTVLSSSSGMKIKGNVEFLIYSKKSNFENVMHNIAADVARIFCNINEGTVTTLQSQLQTRPIFFKHAMYVSNYVLVFYRNSGSAS